MRLSDLLEHTVIDTGGRGWGPIHDVLLIQDGPLTASGEASYRIHGLIAGPHDFATRLGYATRPATDGNETRGPWPIRAFLRRAHQEAVYIPWSAVQDIDDEITVRVPPNGFERAAEATAV
ncbi:MAG: hypothetical protein JWM89_1260 [Acidimicrobiales bacterium]|nr:hypothetical protein [Acidimicrobiales bacterium]